MNQDKVKQYIQDNGAKHFTSLGECFFGFGESSDNEAIKRKNYDTNVSENINKTSDSIAVAQVYSSENQNSVFGQIVSKGKLFKIRNIKPCECKIYKVINAKQLEQMTNSK